MCPNRRRHPLPRSVLLCAQVLFLRCKGSVYKCWAQSESEKHDLLEIVQGLRTKLEEQKQSFQVGLGATLRKL